MPAPAGAAPGDLLVAAVSSRGAPTVSAPPGWTPVRVDSNGFTMNQSLFVRPATTDNASTWTLSRAQDHVVQVVAYRGVDTTDPVVASAGGPANSASIDSPSVDAVDGAQVVTVAGIGRITTLSPTPPLTERVEVSTDSSAGYALTADVGDTTARISPAGPYTTEAAGSAGGVGQSLSLRPQTGGGGTGGGTGPDSASPTVPGGVTGTPTSPTTVDLTWQPATDDTGVTEYRVFRDGTQVGTSATTSFTDTGLTAGTAYAYTVAAADAAGNVSAPSAPATEVTTPPAGGNPGTGGGDTEFIAAATGTGSTATTVPAPAGVQAGDVLVAAVSLRGTAVITPDAGWTLVREDANGFTMRQSLYVKVATGGDESSTWTLNRAQDHVVQVLAYRGIDTTDPVVTSAGQATSSATLISPETGSTPGGTAITFAGIARTTPLAPELPERSEITVDTAARYKITANAADTTTAGTTAGPFSTQANGNTAGIAQTITLRAAP